jgi:hypothetical protein
MRLINGRFLLPLLLLTAQASAAPTEPFLPQIETQPDDASFLRDLVDALRGRPARADLTVTVTDTDGRPLAGATVLAGSAPGVPFPGNQAVTGADGRATFSSRALRRGAVPVTASLDGFSTVSVLDNRDSLVALSLQRHTDERGYGFVRGHLNGIPRLGGGDLELGFFIPAARAETLLNFDIQSFVSSYTVKVNVYGDQDIPGNVVLPTQSKHYGIIPIKISKPDYIMPLPTTTDAHMYGIAGGISIKSAVSVVQKKDFLELVNLVRLTNVGWTRERVQIHGNESFDINATHVVQPNNLTAQVSGANGFDVVAVSLLDPAGDKGDFVAMDVKAIKKENLSNGAGSMRLGQIRSRRALANSYVFAALFDRTQIDNEASRWVVGSVQPSGSSSSVSFRRFLNPIRPQSVSADRRDYSFTPPANGGLEPGLMLINIVSEKKNPETMGKTRTVLWSAVIRGGAAHLSLPDLGHPVLPAPDTAAGETFHYEITAVRTGSRPHHGGLDLQASLRDLQDVSTLVQSY